MQESRSCKKNNNNNLIKVPHAKKKIQKKKNPVDRFYCKIWKGYNSIFKKKLQFNFFTLPFGENILHSPFKMAIKY